MTHIWNYSGDLNLREGGLFWREDGAEDYVIAVKVTPCSDAGGADNLFHIESGSIFIGDDAKRIASALDSIGMTPDVATRRDTVEAMNGYCGLDDADVTVVRIGRADEDASPNGWNPEPDVVLRGNAKLRNYVRREFLN